MIISHCLMPNGGWVYTQGKIRLMGETFDLLVANVKAHRQANGIPQGDIASDIETQIGTTHPHLRKPKVLA